MDDITFKKILLKSGMFNRGETQEAGFIKEALSILGITAGVLLIFGIASSVNLGGNKTLTRSPNIPPTPQVDLTQEPTSNSGIAPLGQQRTIPRESLRDTIIPLTEEEKSKLPTLPSSLIPFPDQQTFEGTIPNLANINAILYAEQPKGIIVGELIQLGSSPDNPNHGTVNATVLKQINGLLKSVKGANAIVISRVDNIGPNNGQSDGLTVQATVYTPVSGDTYPVKPKLVGIDGQSSINNTQLGIDAINRRALIDENGNFSRLIAFEPTSLRVYAVVLPEESNGGVRYTIGGQSYSATSYPVGKVPDQTTVPLK